MSTQNADSIPIVARELNNLRTLVGKWRDRGETVAFIPTMGALHEGHLSLIAHGSSLADHVVASIFVNPKQFAPHEDFDSYPREEMKDLKLLGSAGCDLAYIPAPATIYPEGFQTEVKVGELSQDLCGHSRPHFFGGVATIVCKLLNQVSPTVAIFGEKDFQQLLIIKRMVKDLDMNIEIVGAQIIREHDGLAMSSRNAYLSATQRKTAGSLNKALADLAEKISAGEDHNAAIEQTEKNLIACGFDEVDYLKILTQDNLSAPTLATSPHNLRIFVAAILGKTRLIDNRPVES